LHTLVEEIAEMFVKCNTRNFLKHIFQGLSLWGVQTGVCTYKVPFLLDVFTYIIERSGYTPPLTTLDAHHDNIYAHIIPLCVHACSMLV